MNVYDDTNDIKQPIFRNGFAAAMARHLPGNQSGWPFDDLGRIEQPRRQSRRRRPDLLTTNEAAEHLGISPRTLEDWRTKSDAAGNVQGPKVTRSGGRVFYCRADLDAFQTAEAHLTAGQVRLKQQRRKPRRVTSRTP